MPTMRREWTVEDLLGLPDDGNRYEVLDGELFVTPAPSLPHQRVTLELCSALRTYLLANRVGEVIGAPADVKFSPRRLVQPDVFVIPFASTGRRAGSFADVGRLLLAAEVLSPSTARADRVKKRHAYREEGVPVYWVIDLDARTFERSTPANDQIEVCDATIEWLPKNAATPLVIDVADFFRSALD